ncbi:MAG TPA: TIGR03032 family protein [Thermoanaerobaculia bacterium]|jgi:uncharacterized protein (TIGR03032 family)|nr:TIGR03032 family protein [Thermoanaerobaculia bacterium]
MNPDSQLIELSEEAEPLRSEYDASLLDLLRELGHSLILSTYQSNRVIVVRADGEELNTHFLMFPRPMGIAVGRHQLAIGIQQHVWEYYNQPNVGYKLDPPGQHDACFLPRSCQVTGQINIHEIAFTQQGLWIANTRFSCLAMLDRMHSFVPCWLPPFITALAPEDRCHLNGLAVLDGRVRWVTAFGTTDTPQGWRDGKAQGGVILEVPSGEVVTRGLCMPHSPRWYAGKLWVLDSGRGAVATVDPSTGRVSTVAELPGFTRGLAFAGPLAFVGLSQVRESGTFSGIPLMDRVEERLCGVSVLDIRTGKTLGTLRFEGAVQEIFDVQVLDGLRYPEIVEPDSDLAGLSFILPDPGRPEQASAATWPAA